MKSSFSKRKLATLKAWTDKIVEELLKLYNEYQTLEETLEGTMDIANHVQSKCSQEITSSNS